MSKIYLCLNCFKYNQVTYLVSDKSNIQCTNCGEHKIIEIDDLLAPIVKILNQKGYTTLYCCSGHLCKDGCNTYITFPSNIELPLIPENFILEDKEFYTIQGWDKFYDNTKYSIRRWYMDVRQNDELLYKEIINVHLQLLEWAKILPNLNT